MAKTYRLRLTEVTGDPADREPVVVSLENDAFQMIGWLLFAAVTLTQDDPKAREQLYRLTVVQSARLGREP